MPQRVAILMARSTPFRRDPAEHGEVGLFRRLRRQQIFRQAVLMVRTQFAWEPPALRVREIEMTRYSGRC